MAKTRVAVLRGGPSEEYDVSLKTGASVLQALDPDRYEPLDIVITKQGEWLFRGVARTPDSLLCSVDVVFIALHGAFGEDGRVQRLLDTYRVPYTGSRSYPSAIAMNKAITKDRLRDADILMARHLVVSREDDRSAVEMAREIVAAFGPRYILKPLSGGSSIGTARANSEAELAEAIKRAFTAYEQLIIEEYIQGREATAGVVEHFRGEPLYALPVVEILPPDTCAFFDYDAKYSGATRELCPSTFSHEEKRSIESAARRVHEALGLSHYSRSDFILTPVGPYFLEVNTLPGLTEQSLVPKALDAVGCSYGEFVDHLIAQALGR